LGSAVAGIVNLATPLAFTWTGTAERTVAPFEKVTVPRVFGGPALQDWIVAVSVRLPPVRYHEEGEN
jgi:hypothetical protein